MKYNKLIRDKIHEIILQNGGRLVAHVADEAEYWQKLKEKLLEEVEEFNKEESIEELADVLEVLGAIIYFKKFSREEIIKTKKDKAKKKGVFKKRIILEES